jgi:hypothetical protein
MDHLFELDVRKLSHRTGGGILRQVKLRAKSLPQFHYGDNQSIDPDFGGFGGAVHHRSTRAGGGRATRANLWNRAGSSSYRAPSALAMAAAIWSIMLVDGDDGAADHLTQPFRAGNSPNSAKYSVSKRHSSFVWHPSRCLISSSSRPKGWTLTHRPSNGNRCMAPDS